MYYEEGFRGKVIKFLKRGNSEKEAARVFGVSTSSIWRWQKLEQEQGNFKNRPLNRKHKKVDPREVAQHIEIHKDVHARELAKYFKISEHSMLYILKKKLKYVRKKNSERFANETKIDAQNSGKKSTKGRRNRLYTWMKRV